MTFRLRTLSYLVTLSALVAGLCLAQENGKDEESRPKGTLYVHVMPEEAYIWVDGKPASHRNSMLELPQGEHAIAVYNYGFVPKKETVNVTGAYQEVDMRLQPVQGTVPGPFGRIQIEGVPGDSLVFMNGTTPEFFVGHADEMNDNFFTTQTLVAPVGKHQLYIVRRKTNQPIWSGSLDVKENKRLIVYVKGPSEARVVYKDWSGGKKVKELPRFKAGTASAIIAIAPVKASLAVDRPQIKCNEPAKLSWKSSDATVASIMANNEKVADSPTGELSVNPKQTTKYVFQAAGPGGTVTQEANVAVDPKVEASLDSSTQDLRYVKVGDQVKERGSADLKWSASNADAVELNPVGPLTGTSGTQTVQASPKQANEGPLDETQSYQLTATNQCGGSETRTIALHLTGSIEPEQVAQAEPPPEPTPEPKLPATASPLPSLALFGIASTGAGMLVRRMRKPLRQKN
jgi:PEGA domain-containing protein